MTKDYKGLRADYIPEPGNRKVIFIFESPPVAGAYFYDKADVPGGDQLFGAMMRQILGWPTRRDAAGWVKPAKVVGLRAFADAGYLLMDATYVPINEGYRKSDRKRIIRDSFPELCDDLTHHAEPDTKIIVGMAPVCEVLVPLLKDVGNFNVMNTTASIPLPMCGHERRFGQMVRPLLGLPPLKDQ